MCIEATHRGLKSSSIQATVDRQIVVAPTSEVEVVIEDINRCVREQR